MKNVFIDSNIWLSLYYFSSDDLEKFDNLINLIGKSIHLWITYQVECEVVRNREGKLLESFKSFEKPILQFPVFSKGYEEYDSLKSEYSSFLSKHATWIEKIKDDIRKFKLPADEKIKSAFDKAGIVETNDYLMRARDRYDAGNPPGKKGSYGDAINWVCLLSLVPEGEDLYLISSDKDYYSEIFKDELNPYLKAEWKNAKNSSIHTYKTLESFLKEHFNEVVLENENRKDTLIKMLLSSGSFMETHGVVKALSLEAGWTDEQLRNIGSAIYLNDQVYRIINDEDVFSFVSTILDECKKRGIDEEYIEVLSNAASL